MKLVGFLIIFLSVFLVSYLGAVFVSFEPDITEWEPISRLSLLLISIFITGIITPLVMLEVEE